MRRSMSVVLALSALLLSVGPGTRAEEPARPEDVAYVEIDYAGIDRRIVKEPEYVASPRYALLVFGPKGETRVWAVLDRSSPDLPYYDVLYFDRNADGDLTGPRERITASYDEKWAHVGLAITLGVGEFRVPGTALVHSGIEVQTVPKKGRKGFWFKLKWNRKMPLGCGHAPVGMDCCEWTSSPETAPVLRPNPLGPLSFAIWSGQHLRRGVDNRVQIYAGNAGSGPDTLCTVPNDFLDPERDLVDLTVIAKDARGQPVRGHGRLTGKG